MSRVLIVHASRHGGSAGIAERIGEVLRESGVEADVARARDLPDPAGYDTVVVGAGVYLGSWVEDGITYLEHYAGTLATVPVWLFSSGPLPGPRKRPHREEIDPVEAALGPIEGPGSGGRRKLEEVAARIRRRDHHVFAGVFDSMAPPASMSERLVRMMPMTKGILPDGDFRDWPDIEDWARKIVASLEEPVATA